MSDAKQVKCGCGHSPTGYCVGLHSMTNEQYKKHVEQQALNENAKPQLLKG